MNKQKPMGLLPDWEILNLVSNYKMIEPFQFAMIRSIDDCKVISFGCGSYGYDLRLSPKEFSTFRHVPGTVINPKNFDRRNLEPAELLSDEYGDYFIIPGNSYGLGVAIERLKIPSDVTAIFIGKSTYARCGLIANITPGEAAWAGHLTLEFSNSSPADCRVYANEGVVQALFFRGESCDVSYSDRAGKYMNQSEQIVTSRV